MVSNTLKILLVDDEARFLNSLSERIRLKGHEPLTAASGREAIDCVKSTQVDLALVDYRMPEMNGMVIITKLKELRPYLKTVLLTGHGSAKVQQAAEAIDAGYFEKDKMSDFWQFIRGLSPNPRITHTGNPDRSQPNDDLTGFADGIEPPVLPWAQRLYIVGQSPQIEEIKHNIEKVAALDCPVLIMGETGTGKKLAARNIHMQSLRSHQKFTPVNCSAFNEELLNNELFGHDIEANTGVLHSRKGVIELAPHGTLLFEEIGDAPQSLQVKLIRLLEERTIFRMEGNQEIPVDVRALASTNRNLALEIGTGKFREDLFYALNAFVLRIPPLRERMEDVPLLSNYFLDNYRREFVKDVKRIADEALEMLMAYPFPGNVRELESAIERAVIMCEGDKLETGHFPERIVLNWKTTGLSHDAFLSLAELETKHILDVLRATKGNKSEAAKILGINRASLWRKLKQMGYEE